MKEVGQDIGNPFNAEVDLETEIAELVAASANGWIRLNELSDLTIVRAEVADNGIKISAVGNIFITGILAAGDLEGSVSLISGAEIYMTSQTPISTFSLSTWSQTGLFLRTAVTELVAIISGSGILEIREVDGIVLRNVKNNNGTIRIIAGGTITAAHVESGTDANGNTVGLISITGDVLIDYIGAGNNYGQISVSAVGEIRETDNYDSDVDLKARMVVLAAGGEIDGHHKNAAEKLEKNVKDLFTAEDGKKLHIHERHYKDDACDFDVEIFLHLQGELAVHANGSIKVTYLTGSGKKADLKSHHGDINVEYLDLQEVNDIHLHADRGMIYLESDRYSGEAAKIHGGRNVRLHARYAIQLNSDVTAGYNLDLNSSRGSVIINAPITAGNDVKIHAGESIVINADVTAGDDVAIKTHWGDIELHSAVIAGSGTAAVEPKHGSRHSKSPNVRIDSGGGLFIHGDITAAGDIDMRADEDILVSSTVSAAGDLDMGGAGDMTITITAVVTSGDDIDLDSKADMTISGTVQAADHIKFTSYGDMLIDGIVQAGDDFHGHARGSLTVSGLVASEDRIHLKAREDMYITSTGVLSGLEDNPAKRICLDARDQMIIEGKLLAERIHIH